MTKVVIFILFLVLPKNEVLGHSSPATDKAQGYIMSHANLTLSNSTNAQLHPLNYTAVSTVNSSVPPGTLRWLALDWILPPFSSNTNQCSASQAGSSFEIEDNDESTLYTRSVASLQKVRAKIKIQKSLSSLIFQYKSHSQCSGFLASYTGKQM